MAISNENMVRARFIKQTLQKEGAVLLRRQTGAINQKLKRRTGNLLDSRRVDVYGGNDDFEAMMVFEHPVYERFLDMRKLSNQDKGHKRDIHNRLVFSTYGRIAERLMYGFTDEVRDELKKEIEQIKLFFESTK